MDKRLLRALGEMQERESRGELRQLAAAISPYGWHSSPQERRF